MTDDRVSPVPPGGAQIGLRFIPDTPTVGNTETDEGTNPNPIATSDVLKETLEAQKKQPRP